MFSHGVIKKRILVFGANGMLGQRIISFYQKNDNIELLASCEEEECLNKGVVYVKADLTKRDDVKKIIFEFYPDIIINAAAFTNVDACETQRELSWKVNVKGVEYIAETARTVDAHVIHISSDYIFNGLNGPYTENDVPNPISFYGRTKLAGENVLKMSGILHTILRTNVLYGVAPGGRTDFVRWVVNELRNHRKIRIVTDQFNNPTYVDDLVQAINKVIEFKKFGVYNIGGREFLSRYDFTDKIIDFFDLDKSLVTAIVTEDLKQDAKRPLKSGLIIFKAETELGYQPISINDSLMLMKKELSL
jgi:dTDP-4-dehydrorhamnose reductase